MLNLIIIISLFIVGLKVSFEKGMILNPVYLFIQKLLYKKVKTEGVKGFRLEETNIAKPFIDCVYCMPSIWGSLIYLFVYFAGWNPEVHFIVDWIIILFCSSALSGLIYNKL